MNIHDFAGIKAALGEELGGSIDAFTVYNDRNNDDRLTVLALVYHAGDKELDITKIHTDGIDELERFDASRWHSAMDRYTDVITEDVYSR